MKITSLIIQLLKYRLKGYTTVDFWISYDFPPNDYCYFIKSKYEPNKRITLRNWE